MSPVLTLQQLSFVDHYIKSGNGDQAAKAAGYKGATRVKACRLLQQDNIKAYIEKLRSQIVAQFEASVTDTVKEIGMLAFSDIGEVYHPNGRVKDLDKIPKKTRLAIESIDTVETENKIYIRRVKMHSKMKALEMIAKYLGMYEEENNKKPDINLNIQFV